MYHMDGKFAAKSYDSGYYKSISGATDNRGWKKNLLEVEQVQNFTVEGHNLGEVFIIKSEFSPTAYAIQGKWVPVYEYYIKDENGEMIRIGSGKLNQETEIMETTISIDGQDRSDDIRYNTDKIEKAKEEGTIIQFNSSEYTGISTKISRKDIEEALITKSIQAYLGKEKQIADITQVKDIPIINYDERGKPQPQNAYIVNCVKNGVESYEIVCIREDGRCEKYPGMNRDMLAKKEMYFPTGMTTGDDKQTSLNVVDKKLALETFKAKDGIEYSAYRDENGILRVAQMIEHANGNGKYAEELDTYCVMHKDIEKIKEESKEQSKEESKEESTELRLDSEEDDSVSL